MDTLWFYIDLGFWHVMDLAGLDHLYFIITLAAPFGFKQSKKLIWWVTLFTLGHTLSLIGNFYAEIDFSTLYELAFPKEIEVQPTPKFPSSRRDFALLIGISDVRK